MRSTGGSLALVGDAHRLVDLADDVPVVLVPDAEEPVLRLELLLQIRAFPVEGEEGLLDFRRQRRMQVVDVAVTGRREGGGRVERADLARVDGLAVAPALHHRVGDGRRVVIVVGYAEDGVGVLVGEIRSVLANTWMRDGGGGGE